jgi:hypothetical protein
MDYYQVLDKADAWVDNDGIINTVEWFGYKLYYIYTQHYIMAPLATIGIISIYFFIFRLYRKNKALNLRLKRFEQELRREELNA